MHWLKEEIQDEENMLLGMQYNIELNSFEATRHFWGDHPCNMMELEKPMSHIL